MTPASLEEIIWISLRALAPAHPLSCPTDLFPAGDFTVCRLHQTNNGARKRRLAAAGFATTPSVSPSYRRSVTPSTAYGVFGGCQNHCFPSLISKMCSESAFRGELLRCSITPSHNGSSTGLKQAREATGLSNFKWRRIADLHHSMGTTRLGEWTPFRQNAISGRLRNRQHSAPRYQTRHRIKQAYRGTDERADKKTSRLTVFHGCARHTLRGPYRKYPRPRADRG